MKKYLIAIMSLAAVIALAGCGSSDSEQTESASALDNTAALVQETVSGGDEALASVNGGEEVPAEAAFPTGVPLNQDAYVEFDEPKMYEVTEDCISWSGNDVQTSGGDLYQGSVVTVVASDGNYLILDDQRVVEASHLQLFE